jgi:hypothetical protein
MRVSHRFVVLCMVALCLAVVALQSVVLAQEGPHASAQAVVEELYKLVTFEAGTTPDWGQVRALFLDEAVIVLRTSLTETSVLSVDGFVQDFVDFIETANVEKSGFSEKVVLTKPIVFGDIANILVIYEAQIPGSGRDPLRGVDSFHLIRLDRRWRIASIVNEIVMPDRPLPQELQP